MPIVANQITIRMALNGFPVEIVAHDTDLGISPFDVKELINQYVAEGFTPPVQWTKTGTTSLIGKRAIFEGAPVFLAEKKMWQYKVTLDDGKEFKWNEFSRTAIRKGDMVEIQKNDNGFTVGVVIDPQTMLPGMDNAAIDEALQDNSHNL